jgi:hypothetical protein
LTFSCLLGQTKRYNRYVNQSIHLLINEFNVANRSTSKRIGNSKGVALPRTVVLVHYRGEIVVKEFYHIRSSRLTTEYTEGRSVKYGKNLKFSSAYLPLSAVKTLKL